MTFVQAKSFRAGGNLPVNRVVLHTMEAPEKGSTAESVAKYFANGSGGKKSSAHFCVDSDSIVGCVKETDTAYHAPPNRYSIGIEHAGYSAQSAADWSDRYSQAMLRLSAGLCADLCKRHNVPVVWLSVADLKAGKRGITSHNNVSLAFKESTHTDPGPNFPVEQYLSLVKAAMAGAKPAVEPKPVVVPRDPRPVGGYVDGLYAVLLGRPADPAGRKWWVERLKTDTSRYDAALAFAKSKENLADEIGALYALAFGRPVEPDALNFWADFIVKGHKLPELVATLFSSAEFGASNPGDEDFVKALYRLFLGREADGEAAFWVAETAKTSRGAVAKRLWNSREACGRRVSRLYKQVFGREPDAAGLTYWSGELAKSDDIDLVAALLASEEYFAAHQAE